VEGGGQVSPLSGAPQDISERGFTLFLQSSLCGFGSGNWLAM